MNEDEKINLLIDYESLDEFLDEHFLVLREFAFDEEPMIRSMTAAHLVQYTSESAKELLLMLANDDDSFVRTEAYDSLAVFSSEDVQSFLHEAIKDERDYLARSYAILAYA